MSRIWTLIPAFALVMGFLFINEWLKSNPNAGLYFVYLIGFLFVAYAAMAVAVRNYELFKLRSCLEGLGGFVPVECQLYSYLEGDFNRVKSHLEIDIFTMLVDNKIKKYIDILKRKRMQQVYLDDYGVAVTNAWERECGHFVVNVLFPVDFSLVVDVSSGLAKTCEYYSDLSNYRMIDMWVSRVDYLVAQENSDGSDGLYDGGDLDDVLTGHDYEHYVASIMSGFGWVAKVTKGSGDHGADVIAERSGVRIAVQCKYYSSPVGNKSVQEAYSAKGFYDCNHACVITNSSFTPSARKAAAKLGVSLLHHEDIGGYLAS